MSNEDRLEHVLEVLGVLARLTDNKRLFLRNKNLYIEGNRTLKIISRWYYKEHERCFEHIKEIVNEALDMAHIALEKWTSAANQPNSYIEQQRQMRQYGRLTQALEGAIFGIGTQMTTYKNDEHYCSRVEVLNNRIRDKLTDMDLKVQMINGPGTTTSGGLSENQVTATKPQSPPVVNTYKTNSIEDSDEVGIDF
jgi:hypothetical protein